MVHELKGNEIFENRSEKIPTRGRAKGWKERERKRERRAAAERSGR